MPRTTCPSCGLRVLVLSDERSGDELVVDPWPSLHGYVERVSVATDLGRVQDERRPGTYRLHVETCGRA